MDKSDPTAVY